MLETALMCVVLRTFFGRRKKQGKPTRSRLHPLLLSLLLSLSFSLSPSLSMPSAKSAGDVARAVASSYVSLSFAASYEKSAAALLLGRRQPTITCIRKAKRKAR